MNSGMYTRRSNILRVGKDILVLLEVTILCSKTAGNNTSWFTDIEMLELLTLVRDVVCKRVEEYPHQKLEMKRKKKETLRKTGIKVHPHVMLTGERVKMGVQFVKHCISRTCLLPKESPGPPDDESYNHSGGGYDVLYLFPEKLQVIVCEYMPLNGTSNDNQQISSYFESTKTTSDKDKTQTNTAKKKKLQLKRIVASSSGSSVCKKSTLQGGFETSVVPSSSSKPLSPSCQQRNEEEKRNSSENTPLLPDDDIAAASDVNVTSETDHKIASEEKTDVFSFESDLEQDEMEIKFTPQQNDTKEPEMSNPEKDGSATSLSCGSPSRECLLDPPLNNKCLKEKDTLQKCNEKGVNGGASGRKQSKLSLKRDKRNRDELIVYSSGVSDVVDDQHDASVKPSVKVTQDNLETDYQVNAADSTTIPVSGKKRKLGNTNVYDDDDSVTESIISKGEDTYSAIPESCSSKVRSGEIGCLPSPDGKMKRRKLTKKLSQSCKRWDFSSSDDDESFNIDIFRLKKNKKKKGDRKTLRNSEGDISGESGQDTGLVGGKCHDQFDNDFISDGDTLPDVNFMKGTTAGTRDQTDEENEGSKGGRVSLTFDRSLRSSKVNGVSKFKQQPKIFQHQTSQKTKRTEAGNDNGLISQLIGEKGDHKCKKKYKYNSNANMEVPIYLSDDSRDAHVKNVSGVEKSVITSRTNENELDVGNSLNIAGQCQSYKSGSRNDEKKLSKDKKILSPKKMQQCYQDTQNLKEETCQTFANNISSDEESLPELDLRKQNVNQSYEKGKIFSFEDNSKYSAKDKPVTQDGERNRRTFRESPDGSPQGNLPSTQDDLLSAQDDLLSSQDDLPSAQDDFFSAQDDLPCAQDDLFSAQDDLPSAQDDLFSAQNNLPSSDSQQENVFSSPRLKKPLSSKQNFFQVDNYENVESSSDDVSFERKFAKAVTKKKPPLRTKNTQNGGPFGSLKPFDDTAATKKSKQFSKQNRRCSQIQVTPQNLDKWWLPKNGKKKEKKLEVVDLVAMEEKMEEALKLVKSVSELTEEQLRYLTQNNEDYLTEIFQGKKPCHRHQEYKSSSALRTRMTYLVSYGDFPEDSLETIMDSLVPMFCKKGSKYLDYVSKVLLPELLVKICMDVLHVDYQEAEKMF